eukprot:m.356808 g.356808  ORF g.356808 m.356808 type:complete len:256 (-) comp17632_c0_seq1:190-957(-)
MLRAVRRVEGFCIAAAWRNVITRSIKTSSVTSATSSTADMELDVAAMRESYEGQPIAAGSLHADPLQQFRLWLEDAVKAKQQEPNAMTLATVDDQGLPDARMVLLKGVDDRGFRFFTNRESAKGQQLAVTPTASLVFWWFSCHRSVRVHGSVEKLSDEESAAYFKTRPFGSQLGAVVSKQSQPLEDPAQLQEQMAVLKQEYEGREDELEMPAYWGGYRVVPTWVEFWQGQRNRVHNRVRYTKQADGSFTQGMLQP